MSILPSPSPAPPKPAAAGVVLAIDPGHTHSAYVLYDAELRILLDFGKVPNERLRGMLLYPCGTLGHLRADHLVIEQIASYGRPVGEEVFETVFWSGRFAEAWSIDGCSWSRVKRMAVKMHLCHDSRAKDPHIRQALIDKFGPGKDKAVGKKATPGPLYGVTADVWAALAVAVTFAEGGTS